MSQLLCYWEEADRCLNHGEVKIKTHCPLSKLLLKFIVATVKHSCWSTSPSPLFCSISDYSLSWQMLLTHWTPHELPHLSPGLSDIQGVPKVCSSNFMRYNFWSKLHFYMKFLKYVSYSIEYLCWEVQLPASPFCFLSHPVAVSALSEISHVACRALDDSFWAFLSPSMQESLRPPNNIIL